MLRLIIATALLAIGSTVAMADEKPTADEIKSIEAALEKLGCKGGEYEKEDEASGVYEIDDTKCADGLQFDVKLDKDFNLIVMSRD
ncbi:MAG: PepSY domain-containing protein [Pseudomonadota bacterium]